MTSPPDEYVYDPRDPVMTLYTPPGQQEPHDQRPLDWRRDVLVYRTPPLTEALEVTGPITVRLWAASTARDTDFVVKVVDRWPDGFAQELCHGIVRARYRDSLAQPTLLGPGRAYEYTHRGQPDQQSLPARATGWRSTFRAATSRTSTATTIPAGTTTPRRPWSRLGRPSFTTPRGHRA